MLNAGDFAPDFTLENQNGELITSWDKLQSITTENEKQGVYFEKE